MSDLVFTLLIIATFFGGALILAFLFHALFSRLIGRPSANKPGGSSGQVSDQKLSSLSPTVDSIASNEARVALQLAMQDFGITAHEGDELRMGWYEWTFKLAQPVAGIEEVWTLHGSVSFSDGNRCAVIADCERLVILDRTLNRGARLEVSRGWFDSSVDGSILRIPYHPLHGSKDVSMVFEIDLHTVDQEKLLPRGWPGRTELLPAAI